jgi:hypothetical protein
MKAIPWGAMDLYKLHSNPEKLIHNGEFRYLPSQEAMGEMSDYYENWITHSEDESYNGTSEWTLSYLDSQVQEDIFQYDYAMNRGEDMEHYYRGALFDYSPEQLKILYHYVMARMDSELELTVQNFAKYYDEYRIRFSKKLDW